MVTNERLIEYLKSKDKIEAQQILINNGMQHMFGNLLDWDTISKNKQKLAYKLIARKQRNFIHTLSVMFEKAGIEFIIFKGMILSYLLYEDYEYRQSSDIDIYVQQEDYKHALELLQENGFYIRKKEGYGEDHHIVLLHGNIMIELHKHIIAPECNMDESYLLQHTMIVEGIKTFDITATFLHLIYHIYSDTFTTTDMYSLYLLLLHPKRFLFREYELVLFAEKYAAQINWNDIIDEIKKQSLRITFRYMFDDITHIFPNVLPQKLVKTIESLEYYEKNDDVTITKILAGKFSYEKEYIKTNLSQYIEENWNPFGDALYKKLGDNFFIESNDNINDMAIKECECTFSIDKYERGICLSFEVTDTDFAFSDKTFPNVHRSDGVQLFMCGTKQYSYQNIFMFPRLNAGNYEVIPYNVIKRYIIKKNSVDAKIEIENEKYRMTIYLTEKFLAENQMDDFFYLNVVICDCDSKTQKRKNTLNLIRQSESWYNPIYFVKIDCRNL